MLAYTIERELTQRVVLERDQGTRDRYGAKSKRDWKPLATVPCKHWWIKQSYRGPAKEEATASQTVAVGEGAVLIQSDVNLAVTTSDRIASITDPAGNTLVDGPLNITAALAHSSYPPLTELWFVRPD